MDVDIAMNHDNGLDLKIDKVLLDELARHAEQMNRIPLDLYQKYSVKRGLRNDDGTGVLVGLTEIGDVHGYIIDEGEIVSVEGRLEYRGINVFLLGCQGFSSPYWLTFKQAKALGGSVRKGERATPVVFWKWIERQISDPETGEIETKQIPLVRYYSVFNVEQCDRLTHKRLEAEQQEPVRRKVALKIIKPGMDTKEVTDAGERIAPNAGGVRHSALRRVPENADYADQITLSHPKAGD